jgi:hypothetical protein
MRRMSAVFAIGLVIGGTPALAADSLYTKYDWETCKKIAKEDDTTTRRCAGPGGLVVMYSAGEDSAFVAFGAKGVRGETSLGEFYFPRDTVEWRNAAGAPVAAILRYDIGRSISGPFKSSLVVYKLEGSKSSCVVGVVNGGRKDANERAREIADKHAVSFACDRDPILRE